MNESDYHRYIDAFNARDYAAMERFLADDVALENAGFVVRGKTAFREFYQDLTPEILSQHGFSGMTPITRGAIVELEFLILYELNVEGLIRHIKGAVWVPALH